MQNRFYGMDEVFFALCKAVNTPVSLGAWLRFKYAHEELAKATVDPRDYEAAASFRIDYSVCELLSKWKGLRTGINTKQVAMSRFTLAETQCEDANVRIRLSRKAVNPAIDGIIHSARRKIARLFGPYSNFCIEGFVGWGPGATFEIPRRRAAVDTKMCELPITVTRKCLELLKSTIESDLHWSYSILGVFPEGPYSLRKECFQIVEGNRIDTVPKNAKTDRVIAVEPRGNSFLQKGYGGFIRSRLRRVGIDLDDQTRNQELARIAVRDSLATVDLSMASDTVAKELVFELLPWDWASALDDVRSPKILMKDGEWLTVEKFSSMGNGFTFELETLIFWALTQAITDDEFPGGVVSVYGDDIICQTQIVPKLRTVLSWAGFTFNEDKSHWTGLFRESCGKHYFDGQDVTPAYQKEEIRSLPEKIRLGNRLIRLAERWGEGRWLDRRLENAWRAVRRSAPSHPVLSIPYGVEGDDGWALPYTEFPFGRIDPNLGIRCRVFRGLERRLPAFDEAILAWTYRRKVRSKVPLLGSDEEPFDGTLTFPDKSEHSFEVFQRWVMPTGKFSIRWQ